MAPLVTIPSAVLDHWSERLAEIASSLHAEDPTDATYRKVLAARNACPCRIVADDADLRELKAETDAWLDDETDVSSGRDREDRRIRAGYRRLRASLRKASTP